MIQTSNLKIAFDNTLSFQFPDLQCKSRDTVLILGNSGTGKTTLLNVLGGIIKPDSGNIYIDQEDFTSLNNKQRVMYRAKNVGIIYQKSYFIQSLNVLDNLLLPNYLANVAMNKQKALELAENLGFENKLKSIVMQLSGGEQQRVCIARALMNQPKVVLADEPTSALDDENCDKVVKLLVEESQKCGATLVIVTHDQRLKNIFQNKIMLQ